MGAEQTGNVFASGELLATETGELSQWVKSWSGPIYERIRIQTSVMNHWNDSARAND